MSDSPAAEIQINVKGPSELKLQITISPDKTVLDLKQAIAAKSDVEVDRQRLIYSGRVLKDEDLLSVYKIQSSHTIHVVRGVRRSGASSSSPSAVSAPSQQLPTMQTGQNPHDPLTQLNSHMGFGAMAGLNPFGELGINPNDPNMMQAMMNSPHFVQQMSSMMSDPGIIDQVIAMNPQLAAMGPQVREAFNSEGFRQMISNPETFQNMMRMATMFQGPGGGGPVGNAFGGAPVAFPAPGNPTGTPAASTTGTTPDAVPPNLFGAPGAAAGGVNPMFNPALMQQMFGANPWAAGGAGAGAGTGAGGFGGFGGFGAPAAPADTRPPEERFQVQLQQLQDMGFTNAQQNVRALLATGGNVHSAIEYILGGGGI